jgi:hypothetical protein
MGVNKLDDNKTRRSGRTTVDGDEGMARGDCVTRAVNRSVPASLRLSWGSERDAETPQRVELANRGLVTN